MNFRKMMTYSVTFAVLAISHAEAQSAKDLPPAWPRPGSALLVENDRGAAYNVDYPKDQPSPMHQHRYPFAGLDLNTATIKGTSLGGATGFGPVVKDDMWYLPKGTPHMEMSTTDPGRHTVVIDIKGKRVAAAKNTTKWPANKYARYQKKVVDNDDVVIWNCAWSPGADDLTSFNSRDMFIAFAEGGDLSIAAPGEAPKVQHYDAGQAIFLPGGQARTIGSAGGTIHAMLVEMK